MDGGSAFFSNPWKKMGGGSASFSTLGKIRFHPPRSCEGDLDLSDRAIRG